MSRLPPSVYQPPPRLGRGRLNTIIEEREDGPQALKSDSEGDGSDSTVVGRPAAWDPKVFIPAPRTRSSLRTTAFPCSSAASPASSRDPSPASSADEAGRRSSRHSCSESEAGTVFSDECPSLESDPTSFASESTRNSYASGRSTRNRYPALLIPRDSWGSLDASPIKEISLGMSPATKIRLSPRALSALSRSVPADNALPSLGDSNSSASESPCIMENSTPVTPDMRHLDTEAEAWGAPPALALQTQHLEITLDDGHSVILSPAEAHSDLPFPSPVAWTDMVVSFPRVPGATPQEQSPLMPTIEELKHFDDQLPTLPSPPSLGSDQGVRLPPDAFKALQQLTRVDPLDRASISSGSSRPSKRSGKSLEMRERAEPRAWNRPRSADVGTPVSDYSFSQLSIPSPGGFFSSLHAGSRHTWCIGKTKTSSAPNSAAAEMFYSRPWDVAAAAAVAAPVISTVVEVDDTNMTDGPPSAKQVKPTSFDAPKVTKHKSQPSEDDDLYGPGVDPAKPSPAAVPSFEYDEHYPEDLRRAAHQNIDRTGSWLAAQLSHLSDILLSDPNFDIDADAKADAGTLESERDPSTTSFTVKADDAEDQWKASPNSEPGEKEPIFLKAFEHLWDRGRRRDAFIQARPRLEAARTNRLVVKESHLTNLLGQHVLDQPQRPSYTGPFCHNPRRSYAVESLAATHTVYQDVEREQLALASIEQSQWHIAALRAVYGGRLLASEAACRRLRTRATLPLDDPACVGRKRIRVLDLGGTCSASWAWHAALEWSNVKVYTVVTKSQARFQCPPGSMKPDSPPNHRTVSVPYLWQLPFRTGHFDVVSARSFHALLKNNPVPGFSEIDEWALTLKECFRVLKSGGYLDFMVMDSTIAHAGPRANALSTEFGFELQQRGYEREPGRTWLRRLRKEGFVGLKRAWMFLPMGRPAPVETDDSKHAYSAGWPSGRPGTKPFVPAPRPISEVSTISKIITQYMDVEAVQGPVGSTEEVADLTGLLGSRMWEEWVVKMRAECGRERARWLEGVEEVIDEGKERGAGWKVLIGWARKPHVPKPPARERGEILVAVDAMNTKLLDAVHAVHAMGAAGAVDDLTSPSAEFTETGTIPMLIEE